MEEKIKEILSEVSGVPLAELREDTRLVGDLGMSSFDLADTVVSVEETYGVKIPDEPRRSSSITASSSTRTTAAESSSLPAGAGR